MAASVQLPLEVVNTGDGCNLRLNLGRGVAVDGPNLIGLGGLEYLGSDDQAVPNIPGIQSLPPSFGTAISGSGVTLTVDNTGNDREALAQIYNIDTVIDGDDYVPQLSAFSAAIVITGGTTDALQGPILNYNGALTNWCTPSFDGHVIALVPANSIALFACVVYIGHPDGTWRKTGGHTRCGVDWFSTINP